MGNQNNSTPTSQARVRKRRYGHGHQLRRHRIPNVPLTLLCQVVDSENGVFSNYVHAHNDPFRPLAKHIVIIDGLMLKISASTNSQSTHKKHHRRKDPTPSRNPCLQQRVQPRLYRSVSYEGSSINPSPLRHSSILVHDDISSMLY